jgi:hypothetical protein
VAEDCCVRIQRTALFKHPLQSWKKIFMLQSVWSHFYQHRSIPPVRDMFDADLDRARDKQGCTLCRLVAEHDRQLMFSFLWEYCTDPHVSQEISQSWGFCAYHTWALALLEHERLGDGLGITIVYQALLKQLLRLLDARQNPKNPHFPVTLPGGPEIASQHCHFCQSAKQEEKRFLARLVVRFQQALKNGLDESWPSLQTTLCFPHLASLVEQSSPIAAIPRPFWKRLYSLYQPPLAMRNQEGKRQVLATRLADYTLQQYLATENKSHLVKQTELNDWNQIEQLVALHIGKLEALPVHSQMQAGSTLPRHLLFLTRQQLQTPSIQRCPGCTAAAAAGITRSKEIFEGGTRAAIPSLCWNHQWLLAACIVPQQQEQAREGYLSWLNEQVRLRVSFQQTQEVQYVQQHCPACNATSEAGKDAIHTFIQDMRRTANDGMTVMHGHLLCLFHWRQAQQECIGESDSSIQQRRLYIQQQRHLFQLDTDVEAYIARFNASKRERGEVPDVPGAAWAWERLLVFFAGEPALVLPVRI